jgi:hypothetical protein
MEQTATRPKNRRPLQNLLPTTQDRFVAAAPSRVFRDGTGRFMVKRSHCPGAGASGRTDILTEELVLGLQWHIGRGALAAATTKEAQTISATSIPVVKLFIAAFFWSAFSRNFCDTNSRLLSQMAALQA